MRVREIDGRAYFFEYGFCDTFTHPTKKRYSSKELQMMARSMAQARRWWKGQSPQKKDEAIRIERANFRRTALREGDKALLYLKILFF